MHQWIQNRLVTPDVFWCAVAGDDDETGPDLARRPLEFGHERVSVGPYLQQITEVVMGLVDVIDDDGLLAFVAIPPLVHSLAVVVGEILPGLAGLASTWSSPKP